MLKFLKKLILRSKSITLSTLLKPNIVFYSLLSDIDFPVVVPASDFHKIEFKARETGQWKKKGNRSYCYLLKQR